MVSIRKIPIFNTPPFPTVGTLVDIPARFISTFDNIFERYFHHAEIMPQVPRTKNINTSVSLHLFSVKSLKNLPLSIFAEIVT